MAEFREPSSTFLPPPPSTGPFNRKYVHDSVRKIKFIDLQLSGIPRANSYDPGRSSAARNRRLQAVKGVINNRVNSYIESHSAPECRALFNAVYKALPLELREMVYKWIFAGTHIYVKMDQLDLAPKGFGKPVFRPNFIKSYAQSEFDDWTAKARAAYGHVFMTTFVEDIVRCELINTWYQVMTFNFDNESDFPPKHPDYISQVMHLLEHDRWGTGFDLRQLVKNVQITYVTALTLLDHPLKFDHPLLKLPETPVLDAVAKLEPSTKITLYALNVKCSCYDKRCLDLVTEVQRMYVLLDQVQLLLEHGYTVWIDVSHRLKFQAKIEELSEQCWADKAAAAQAQCANAPSATRCRRKYGI